MTKPWNPTAGQLSVRDAAYHTVHDFPGGSGALSVRMGVGQAVLCHKVSPNYEARNHLTIEDAVKLMSITQDFRVLHALARECGHTAIRDDATPSQGVHTDINATVREFSDFLSGVTHAIGDGRVTDRELRDIDAQLGTMINQANALRSALAGLNAELRNNLRSIG